MLFVNQFLTIFRLFLAGKDVIIEKRQVNPVSQSLDTPIRYLKGVGEKRAALYQKLGVSTIGDLIRYYPRAYIDLSQPQAVADAPYDRPCAVVATVISKSGEQRIRRGLSLFKVKATDGASDFIITFFNAKYTVEALLPDTPYIFYGRMGGKLTRREMSAPMVLPFDPSRGFLAVYPLTAGLTNRSIAAGVAQALELVQGSVEDPLPDALRRRLGLCHSVYALENIHRPADGHALGLARRRLIFEELFVLNLAMASIRTGNRGRSGAPMRATAFDSFYGSLPFEPTGAQRRVIAECAADLCAAAPMNRLVQGDVGCGKTLVGAACAWFAIQNGYQCAMMAPTEILAEQHRRTLSSLLEPLGVRVGLLTGSMKAAEKRAVRQSLAAGEIDLIVGTHALIQDGVEFAKLGLVITDEQHRFGVGQRMALQQKGENPHVLVMSATPIPRTLALIIYGDLDVSVIDELPRGRQPVHTYVIDPPKRRRAYGFLRRYLDEGRQGYVVCPLVEQGELDLGLESAAEYAARLSAQEFAHYRVGLLHGKMKPAEKEKVMRAFSQGEIQLLVATTVIEVGVDVPNATVMLIENAERFGLSQLHQLRGRIGRGGGESFCILVTDRDLERLAVIRGTTDGFRISEEDLRLRGPGDFFGSRQHGLPQLKIADMLTDVSLLREAQDAAAELLARDPKLTRPEHAALRAQVEAMISNAEV
ncbi:ATP-dependent DNA helicase RecG [Clostridiaceae bacterium NSJ-31]|uniref:ATP-dependent DNA helicase RecG n=1 Tax=Ligaoa zhengdingensis TaxID=2763658 RepID=A0A926I4N3_9FIRM|nr:ATP-dependent DNA helicase RecG [Ligaoa zhengdingensis]